MDTPRVMTKKAVSGVEAAYLAGAVGLFAAGVSSITSTLLITQLRGSIEAIHNQSIMNEKRSKTRSDAIEAQCKMSNMKVAYEANQRSQALERKIVSNEKETIDKFDLVYNNIQKVVNIAKNMKGDSVGASDTAVKSDIEDLFKENEAMILKLSQQKIEIEDTQKSLQNIKERPTRLRNEISDMLDDKTFTKKDAATREGDKYHDIFDDVKWTLELTQHDAHAVNSRPIRKRSDILGIIMYNYPDTTSQLAMKADKILKEWGTNGTLLPIQQ